MADKKVTEAEINKAMSNFMKNASMPSGMIPPIMGMMGNSGMLPSAMPPVNPLMTQQTQVVPQMAQQGYNPYMMGTPIMGQQMMGGQMPANFKAVGLGTRVRLGKQKVREFGKCADCAHCSPEQVADQKYLWCNNKQIRVLPDSGLIMIEIDNQGKKETKIDTGKSCRHFSKLG